MQKNFEQWLADGEQIYNQRLDEFRQLEQQIDELQRQLSSKSAEVNQIAAMIGKPPMELARRTPGENRVVTGDVIDPGTTPTASNIARALNGRLGR